MDQGFLRASGAVFPINTTKKMSCVNCERAQYDREHGAAGQAFYRFGKANIEVIGCDDHLRQVFDALNDHQRKLKWNCEVCGDLRPDAYISVLKYAIIENPETSKGRFHGMYRNLKYCNDRVGCMKLAIQKANKFEV